MLAMFCKVWKHVSHILTKSFFPPLVPSTPENVTAVVSGLTSVLMSWSESSENTGYIIYYWSSGGDNDSIDISNSSTTHILTNLQNGEVYDISIVATSVHFHSEAIDIIVKLGNDEQKI